MENNILVIDDDKVIRDSFVLTFEDSAVKVTTAKDGIEGLNLFRKNHYNIVFLDLKMPGMSGVEVLEKMNQVKKDALIYIITAFHQEFFDELIRIREKGCKFQILQKPLNSGQLKEAVVQILEKNNA